MAAKRSMKRLHRLIRCELVQILDNSALAGYPLRTMAIASAPTRFLAPPRRAEGTKPRRKRLIFLTPRT
jgi:hypothetical protein